MYNTTSLYEGSYLYAAENRALMLTLRSCYQRIFYTIIDTVVIIRNLIKENFYSNGNKSFTTYYTSIVETCMCANVYIAAKNNTV